MINQGLKNYTKQITSSIGRINYYVNPNKSSSNLIFDIPVIIKQSNKKVGLNILYNHQFKSIDNKFGLGYKCNYDISITELNTCLKFINYDNVEYLFYKDNNEITEDLIVILDNDNNGTISQNEIFTIKKNKYETYINRELNFKINKLIEGLIDNKYKYQLIDKNNTFIILIQVVN